MNKIFRNDQSVIPHQRFARCDYAFLAVCCEREVCVAGVAAIKGPFCFAVADDEAPGSHLVNERVDEEESTGLFSCCVGMSGQIGCVIAVRTR